MRGIVLAAFVIAAPTLLQPARAGQTAKSDPWHMQGTPDDPLSFLDSKNWWESHPFARGGLMAQCARRTSSDQMMLRYCNAGRAAARRR